MAVKYMFPVITDYVEESGAYEYTETIASSENGNSIILPPNSRQLTAGLVVSGATGKIQTTISSVSEVIEDEAVWQDWGKSDVTENTTDSFSCCTAIRGVSISGEIKLNVRCQ